MQQGQNKMACRYLPHTNTDHVLNQNISFIVLSITYLMWRRSLNKGYVYLTLGKLLRK